jgi:hypothetical protein
MTRTVCDVCKKNEEQDHRYFDGKIVKVDGVDIEIRFIRHDHRSEKIIKVAGSNV